MLSEITDVPYRRGELWTYRTCARSGGEPG